MTRIHSEANAFQRILCLLVIGEGDVIDVRATCSGVAVCSAVNFTSDPAPQSRDAQGGGDDLTEMLEGTVTGASASKAARAQNTNKAIRARLCRYCQRHRTPSRA